MPLRLMVKILHLCALAKPPLAPALEIYALWLSRCSVNSPPTLRWSLALSTDPASLEPPLLNGLFETVAILERTYVGGTASTKRTAALATRVLFAAVRTGSVHTTTCILDDLLNRRAAELTWSDVKAHSTAIFRSVEQEDPCAALLLYHQTARVTVLFNHARTSILCFGFFGGRLSGLWPIGLIDLNFPRLSARIKDWELQPAPQEAKDWFAAFYGRAFVHVTSEVIAPGFPPGYKSVTRHDLSPSEFMMEPAWAEMER